VIAALVTGVLLVFGCVILISTLSSDGGDAAAVTKAKYDQVREGMSYREVVHIMGSRGEENASSRMEGVPGVMRDLTTKAYSWVNPDGSNMTALFQNDKLIVKAQFGLK
jgi:hypothetical protein